MAHEPDEHNSRDRQRHRNIRRRELASPWVSEQADDYWECVAELTPEQRAEVDRRVEAHAERVAREMEAMGLHFEKPSRPEKVA